MRRQSVERMRSTVHLMRHSLDFVSYKDRKPVAAALKEIYKALDAEAGAAALDGFEAGAWGRKYPAIVQNWRRAWPEVIPVLRLRRRRPPDRLYDKFDRSPERQAAPRRPRPGPLPQRRRRDEAPVPRLEQGRERVDHAAQGMVHGQGAVRRHLR
jgi:putative transposase